MEKIKNRKIVIGAAILFILLILETTMFGVSNGIELLRINEKQLNFMLMNPTDQPIWAIQNTRDISVIAMFMIISSIFNTVNFIVCCILIYYIRKSKY